MTSTGLGRIEPSDWSHVDKYPLTALPSKDKPQGVPVVWGINWYTAFDTPEIYDGRWWIGRGDLGPIRGGHAVCSPSMDQKDSLKWWDFYNQGSEGACVGFAASRMMSLLNRKRYSAEWLYRESQKVDEFEGEDYEGTTVRAALDVLRDHGHCRYRRKDHYEDAALQDGIAANRWATSVDQVLDTLNSPSYVEIGGIPILNSWGRDYPHLVWVPFDVWTRLLDEGGECGLITDR